MIIHMAGLTTEPDYELETLLNLDGSRFESEAGYVLEFTAKRVTPTTGLPHDL